MIIISPLVDNGWHPLHDFFPSTLSHFDHDTITLLSHWGSEGR